MKKQSGRGKERRLLCRDKSGQVLVIVALAAVALIGMVALAVDISHGLVVRHELQSAADASALAGVGNLFTPSPGPNWARAEGAASGSISWNQSDGQSLVNCQVQSGYWNLSQSPAGIQSQGITPGTQDVPAVRVQVGRTPGQNGGSVPTFFARIFGFNSFPVQAQAVAVVSHPGFVTPGPLFPMAISRKLAETWKDHDTPAEKFIIGSAYHYPDTLAGQWTSLLEDHNNVPYIRDLFQNGTSEKIGVGDKIYIQPGTETALYDGKGKQPSAADYIGMDVLLPVVDGILRDGVKQFLPVYGFIGFHIVSVQKAPEKTITGYFVDGLTAPNSGGSGPNFGVITPPHLVL